MGRYFVCGASGNLGGKIIETLLTLVPADQVAVGSSNLTKIEPKKLNKWLKSGVKAYYTDFNDYESMTRSFKDAEAEVVCIISTWDFGEKRRKQYKDCIQAAKESGVKRLHYTSVMGAEVEENTPQVQADHRDAEESVKASGLEWTLQRNNLYINNTLKWYAPASQRVGDVWVSNCYEKKCSFVSRDDCGIVGGYLVAGKGELYRTYVCAGPELISEYDIYTEINKVTGWECKFVNRTKEELYKYYEMIGTPRELTPQMSKSLLPLCGLDLAENADCINRGFLSYLSNDIEELTGKKPESVRELVARSTDIIPKPYED